jgi:hypothetical protein
MCSERLKMNFTTIRTIKINFGGIIPLALGIAGVWLHWQPLTITLLLILSKILVLEWTWEKTEDPWKELAAINRNKK